MATLRRRRRLAEFETDYTTISEFLSVSKNPEVIEFLNTNSRIYADFRDISVMLTAMFVALYKLLLACLPTFFYLITTFSVCGVICVNGCYLLSELFENAVVLRYFYAQTNHEVGIVEERRLGDSVEPFVERIVVSRENLEMADSITLGFNKENAQVIKGTLWKVAIIWISSIMIVVMTSRVFNTSCRDGK